MITTLLDTGLLLRSILASSVHACLPSESFLRPSFLEFSGALTRTLRDSLKGYHLSMDGPLRTWGVGFNKRRHTLLNIIPSSMGIGQSLCS